MLCQWSVPEFIKNPSKISQSLEQPVIVAEVIGKYMENNWEQVGQMVLEVWEKALNHICLGGSLYIHNHKLTENFSDDEQVSIFWFIATWDVLSVIFSCCTYQCKILT